VNSATISSSWGQLSRLPPPEEMWPESFELRAEFTECDQATAVLNPFALVQFEQAGCRTTCGGQTSNRPIAVKPKMVAPSLRTGMKEPCTFAGERID
jgi:hypothetical protein